MQTLRGIAVSPGIAIGPALVLDPRGLRLPHRAIAAEAVAAELDRLDRGLDAGPRRGRGGRGRGPPAARPAVRRHPRRPRPDDRRPDPPPRRPAPDRARPDRRRARRLRGARGPRRPARAADRLAPGRPRRRRPRHPAADPRPARRASGPTSVPDELDGAERSCWRTTSRPARPPGSTPAASSGFATEAGGRASHTAIVAAALEIPAVVGLGRFLDRARALPDGDHRRRRGAGRPRPRRRRPRSATAAPPPSGPRGSQGWPAWPTCPPRPSTAAAVELWGNIEFPGEVAACLERGAVGRRPVPDRVPVPQRRPAADRGRAVRGLRGRRPLAAGPPGHDPDPRPRGRQARLATSSGGHAEPNPALGLRSLRLSLRDPALFRTQLRAILRASTLGDVRVMFPLVSTLGEFRQARADPRRRRRRADRRGASPSATTCPSASWSRSPPPP